MTKVATTISLVFILLGLIEIVIGGIGILNGWSWAHLVLGSGIGVLIGQLIVWVWDYFRGAR